MSDQIAVIADIHGNTWALDAVLANIERREITRIVNLGDCVYGSLDPAGTLERLMDANIITIAGNQDREVFDESEQVRSSRDHHFVTGQLNAAQLEWLEQLPPTQVVEDIFLCHGTPASDLIYLLEHVTEHGVFLHDSATIQAELGDVRQPVVVCGHSHVPRTVWLPDDRLVVNPGSVGIPAYDDDLPHCHKVEAGHPFASYAVLEKVEGMWLPTFRQVAYDHQAMAALAARAGRSEWASALATGWLR